MSKGTGDGGSEQSVWIMELTPNCGLTTCVVDAGIDGRSPMIGAPVDGETVFTVGPKTYVALSSASPATIMELNQGKWQPLQGTQPFLHAYSDGTKLKVATRPSPTLDAGVELMRWDGMTWRPDVTVPVADVYAIPGFVDFQITPESEVMVVTPPLTQVIERWSTGAAGWGYLDNVYTRLDPREVQATSLQTSSGLQSIMALLDMNDNLHLTGIVSRTPIAPSFLEAQVEPGIDVERWGDNALIAYSSNGKIYVGIYWTAQAMNPFRKFTTDQPFNAFNDPVTYGKHPNISVINEEVVVTWEEVESEVYWRMAARVLR